MGKFTWINGMLPDDLVVRPVYGIAFSNMGQVLLRVDDGRYRLTGGHPEKDEDFEANVRREYREEVNIELEEVKYIGCLLVKEDREEYAQVRMIARIKKIGSNRPDSDNGKVYQRLLVV